MRKQFRDTMMALAAEDERVILILGDTSVYLFQEFKSKFPGRFFNMGICESALVSVAAGLSSQGLIPFVHGIAPFLTERVYEQIKLDLSYNQFPARIVTCGASFDYAWDGPTHHTMTDMAILAMLPHVDVVQPGSRKETDILMRSQYASTHATYFRLSDQPHNIDLPVEFGKGVVVKSAQVPVTVMTAGPILANVVEACAPLDVNLVYFHTIKPIDQELIRQFRHTKIMVVHDAFGLFESVCSVSGLSVSFHGPTHDRHLVNYGKLSDVHKFLGLDPVSIRNVIQKHLAAS